MCNKFDRVELNTKICNGKPVIKGTRIPVSGILEEIALKVNRGIVCMLANLN